MMTAEVAPRARGHKSSHGKRRWSLLPVEPMREVVDVFEHGLTKEGRTVDDWQHVSDARTLYYDACRRHIDLWWGGEQRDKESGKHHLAHAVCCLLILIWHDFKRKVT